MKNQNDMIVSIVAIVVALIALGVLYGTKPDPVLPEQSPPVDTTAPTLGAVEVPMTNGVGSGGATGGGGGAGTGGGRGFAPAGLQGAGGGGAPPANTGFGGAGGGGAPRPAGVSAAG